MRQSLGVLMDRQNAPNPAERAETAASNGVVQRFPLPEVPDHYNTAFIPLSVLIDFAVQHCFHELTVLAELLPKKKETERKISVIQFGHSTRCIFLKLLALVRWLRQTRRLDVTKNICFLLDQISFEFVETADILCHLRDELLSARMPIFQVQHAMEAVSTGRCVRVPQCVRKRFIPELTLKHKKQALTLYRLNQLIQRQLSIDSPKIPAGFYTVDVQNGTAILSVYNEFKATVSFLPLTPGAEPQWFLLHLSILVENYEVGEGASLVHPMQTNFLHEMCQHKMKDAENPLSVLYNVVHTFCMKLQLDILYCQASYLVRTFFPKFMTIETYDPRKECLVLSYWSQHKSQRQQNKATQFESDYRIHIWRNRDQQNSILKIRHSPPTRPLPGLYKEDGSLTTIHRLVSETVLLRCGERLEQVYHYLLSIIDVKLEKPRIRMVGTAAVRIVIDLLQTDDSVEDEALHIAMNAFTGDLICKVPVLEARKERIGGREVKHRAELDELEAHLKLKPSNIDGKRIRRALQRLQIKLLKQRFESLAPAVHYRKVFDPFVNITCRNSSIPQEKLCLQFVSEPRYYLLIAFEENADVDTTVRLFLCNTCGTRISAVDLITGDVLKDFSSVPDVFDRNLYDLVQNLNSGSFFQWSSRSVLTIALNQLSEKLLILRMNGQLRQMRVSSTVREYCRYRGYRLELVDFSCSDLPRETLSFAQSLHHCRISSSYGRVIQWVLDLSVDFPATCVQIPSNAIKDHHEIVSRMAVRLPYTQYLPAVSLVQCSSVCHALAIAAIERIRICAALHEPIRELEMVPEVRNAVSVVDYHHYRITIAYGEAKRFLVTVIYKPKLRGFAVMFTQTTMVEDKDGRGSPLDYLGNPIKAEFGAMGDLGLASRFYGLPLHPHHMRDCSWNPHWMVAQHLQEDFNRNKDLVGLVHYLDNSYKIMDVLKWIRTKRPHVIEEFDAMLESKPEKERKAFVRDLRLNIITLSPHRVRMVMGACHLELLLLKDNQVGIEGSIVADKRYHYQTIDEMPFFVEFWRFWGDGTTSVIFDNELKVEEETMDKKSPVNAPSPYASHNGPPSAPSRGETAKSPQNRPNSAAAVFPVNSPNMQNKNTLPNSQRSSPNKRDTPPKTFPTVVVTAETFERANSNYRVKSQDPSEPTPLEQYLYAVNSALFLEIPFRESEELKHAIKGIRRQIRPEASTNGSAKTKAQCANNPSPNGRAEIEVTLD